MTIDKVKADLNKFYNNIKKESEKAVKDTVSTISQQTNSLYSSDRTHQSISVLGNATNFKVSSSGTRIDGIAYANESKNLIYMEFGTRQRSTDTLKIRTDFDSGINTQAIALPYRSERDFVIPDNLEARYYFLNTIDKEGDIFLKKFPK
jgi:hypothetical protein